jgi:hypothetical protein
MSDSRPSLDSRDAFTWPASSAAYEGELERWEEAIVPA